MENNKLIEEINAYKPPLLKSKLKTNYNLLYWRVRKVVYDLPLKHIINSGKAEKSLIESSSMLLTCFCLPDVSSSERLITLIEFMCCFLFVDNYMGFEKSEKGFTDLIAIIYGKKQAETPTEKYISVVFGKIRRSYTTKQFNHLIKNFYDYFEFCKKELLEERDLDSVDKILSSRFNTSGAQPWFSIIEYAMSIDVNKYFCDNRFQRLTQLADTHTFLVNDVFSLKKECENSELRFNTIYYYYKKGNSIMNSVEIILKKIDEIEEEMLKLRKILEIECSYDTELSKYFDGIEYACSGNLMWSLFSPRYNVYNKLAINDIFSDLNNFIELREEFDSLTFNHVWDYTYV